MNDHEENTIQYRRQKYFSDFIVIRDFTIHILCDNRSRLSINIGILFCGYRSRSESACPAL